MTTEDTPTPTDNPSVDVTLLPCPFCGEQPKWRGTRSDYARGLYRLQCLGETHLVQSYGPSEAEAITAWNTRTEPVEVDGLIERLREACDRSGKPSGVHMIDGQRMIAKVMADHLDDEDAQCIAQVSDCMAHCIENEALLFECLRTEALQAADALASLNRAKETPAPSDDWSTGDVDCDGNRLVTVRVDQLVENVRHSPVCETGGRDEDCTCGAVAFLNSALAGEPTEEKE